MVQRETRTRDFRLFLFVQAVVVGTSETLMMELDSYKMLFSRVDGNALAGTLKIEYIKRMVFK